MFSIALPSASALWLLIAALPISVFVAFSDMRTMKIPNVANAALVIGFAVLGLFAFSFDQYLWQWTHLIVVLLVGILLNAVGLVGAGDAKFAAAAAPYVLLTDFGVLIWIMLACVIAGFLMHRLVKHTSLRRAVPNWESWHTGNRFPMGFPLAMTLVAYLVLAIIYG